MEDEGFASNKTIGYEHDGGRTTSTVKQVGAGAVQLTQWQWTVGNGQRLARKQSLSSRIHDAAYAAHMLAKLIETLAARCTQLDESLVPTEQRHLQLSLGRWARPWAGRRLEMLSAANRHSTRLGDEARALKEGRQMLKDQLLGLEKRYKSLNGDVKFASQHSDHASPRKGADLRELNRSISSSAAKLVALERKVEQLGTRVRFSRHLFAGEREGLADAINTGHF